MTLAKFKHYQVFWCVALALLAADQFTKFWAQHLFAATGQPFLAHVAPGLSFVYVQNTGAAWGLFSGSSQLLGLLAICALLALYALRRALQVRRGPMQVAFGLMVAGIIGNMIDRLFLGYVVDFIDLTLLGFRFLVFNLADVGITSGVALYVIFSTWHSLRRGRAASASAGGR